MLRNDYEKVKVKINLFLYFQGGCDGRGMQHAWGENAVKFWWESQKGKETTRKALMQVGR